jgi:hypothetical protein
MARETCSARRGRDGSSPPHFRQNKLRSAQKPLTAIFRAAPFVFPLPTAPASLGCGGSPVSCRKKMRLAWWKRKLSARPGQGFGRGRAGDANGGWACAALPCVRSNKQRQSGFDRAVTDCLCFLFAAAVQQLNEIVRGVLDDRLCCHFAAAIWRTKGPLREPHAESPCFAPHGGSKMTGRTTGDGLHRPHHHNSRGRVHRIPPCLPRAAPSLLHL